MLGLGFLHTKGTPIVKQKMRKNQHVKRLRFSLNTNKYKYPKKLSTQNRLFTAKTPSFCSLSDTKQSLQYTIKTNLTGPPMPKFEANMNYIPPSLSSSMKQCNKSATVKFHMELLLTTTTRKQSRSGVPEAISQWCDTISKDSTNK